MRNPVLCTFVRVISQRLKTNRSGAAQVNKAVLGLSMVQTEGAKFWLQVVTELKNRGVVDIFIACVDGLKSFPDVIEVVFPKTAVQLCLVHMVRHSLNFVG